MRGIFVGALAALVVAGFAGCSDEVGAEAPTADAAVADAGDEKSKARCVAPVDAPRWLDAFLSEHMQKLTGEVAVTGGVSLTDRSTEPMRSAARNYLSAELARIGFEASLDAYASGANVVGKLPVPAGTAATAEWIVVGAHFDSVESSPGANDNASGTAAVLAVARMLSELPCRNRNLMIALFDEEEVSLRGANAFAARERDAGTAIVVAHTVDQVGWDSDDDRTFEIERPSPARFAEYAAGAAAVGARAVEARTGGTDHVAFRTVGYDAVGVTEEYVTGDTTPTRHTPADARSTVKPAYQAMAARMVANVVAKELGAE